MSYRLLKTFVFLVGSLPYPLLYLLSNGLFVLIYSVFGYRKAVVMNNLKLAYPEKTEAERTAIARKFYLSLTDLLVEILKQSAATYPTIRKRFAADMTLFNDLHKQGHNILLVLGHQFNWEMGGWLLTKETPYDVLGVFSPMKGAFGRLVEDWRGRYGMHLIPMNEVKKRAAEFENKQTLTVLIGEQNPSNFDTCHWTDFFGHKVPFHTGFERAARANKGAVVFVEFFKEKRGYYRANYFLLSDRPQDTQPGELTEKFARLIEASVRRQPENWLWTHKRWKHTDKYPYK